MTERVQVKRVAGVLAAANKTLAKVVFNVTNVAGGQFSATVSLFDSGNTEYQVADARGKVRVYKAIDDFMNEATKAGLINGGSSGVQYSFANVMALEPRLYTGDLVKKAQSDLVNIAKQISVANADAANLTAQIALYPSVMTAGEAAQKAERQTQLACIQANKAWLVSEQTRINAIVNPQTTP